MWGKFSNTQKVIMVGIIVLIVVVVVLRINVARLRGPYCQFEDAINAGDVKTAIQAYTRMTGSQKADRVNAEKLAEKALWKHFIKYYYQAYDMALAKRNKRVEDK